MSSKRALAPYQIVTNGNMSSNVTSAVTNIAYLDDVCIQLNWSGTPTGTFAVQGSLDYKQDSLGNVTNAGTWNALTLSSTPTASGSSGSWLIDMATLSFPWVRVVYTAGSGSGTLNAYISGKSLG